MREQHWRNVLEFEFRSTHWYQRHAFVLIVARDSLRARVERQDAIHEKSVAMMSVLEFHRKKPRLVRLALHGMRMRVPIVEVTDDGDGLGLRRIADEIDGAQIHGFRTVGTHSHSFFSATDDIRGKRDTKFFRRSFIAASCAV
jgi:hypothetical protein